MQIVVLHVQSYLFSCSSYYICNLVSAVTCPGILNSLLSWAKGSLPTSLTGPASGKYSRLSVKRGVGAGVGDFSFSFMKECCIRVRGLG